MRGVAGLVAGTMRRVPEILEVESYRRLAERVVGARVVRGWADGYLSKKLATPTAWARAVKGLTVTGTDRRGKLLVLETDGPTLGVRFGMTGVLLLDTETGIEGLFYGPHSFKAQWVRGGLEFADGRRLVVHDPRRLARFEVEPDLEALGPDALTLTRRQLDAALSTERGEGPAVKARLLDQARIAGVGNLLADEALFRAGIDPRTPIGRLDEARRAALHRALRTTTRTLARRGGSHLGDHMAARLRGGLCPLDGEAMTTATIGGRTTYWCPRHQR
ncbi:MAG: DNA-formamidopyrimidine glycosylase family protein [Acidimicrobiales bacterium]